MHREYDPSSVESKWQKKWNDAKLYEVDFKKAKKPFYSLVMFPYPSGDKLHVGHWYNYAPADSYARFKRMQGHDVFSPMGFDAFGLPAENYAIKTGVPPAQSITKNVETMIEQLRHIGCMYDWSKMVNTTDPGYYRWTQWLFLQMFEKKLAYKKEGNVNWCPNDQTVLANEQVKDGRCERCGTEVIQKPLTQWYWKITDYAQKLLDGLDDLDWPEKTKLMQQHWIGRSEGAEITFAIAPDASEKHAPWEDDEAEQDITVFTTRPDTLFGVTYVVLAPEHPLVEKITPKKHWGAVHAYREEVKKKTEMQRTALEKDKTGVATGAFAIHPVTGEKLPIWIGDYVLMNYGTGALMAVPGHDERDYDFAGPHKLPIRCVIEPQKKIANFSFYAYPRFAVTVRDRESLDAAFADRDKQYYQSVLVGDKCWTGPGKLINSDFLNGLNIEEAKKKMIAWLEDNERGRGVINYRLRDWLVSRQRYWGAPIPIVYDPNGNPHPIPEKYLPWLLPTDVEFNPTGKSPLTDSKEFIGRTEKIFGKGWTPEFDTMDTFVCSSFYYLRYLAGSGERVAVSKMDADGLSLTANRLIDPEIERKWMPVSMYIGGPEHATMHLIYARFVMMALKDFGFVSHDEPFQKLVHQGLITNKGAKMSKSKGNVVSPDPFVEKYGSDVFRMYLMFMGPFTDGGDWSDTGIKGIDRFVQRVWKILEKKNDKANDASILTKLHQTIKKVSEGFEALHFNTAISSLMELLNEMESQEYVSHSTLKAFALLLSPIAPHLSQEMWEKLGEKEFVINAEWPSYDPSLLKSDTMTIAVQVSGKLRGTVVVSSSASKEEIIAAAKKDENVAKYIESGIKKKIYVPGKLVSFVV